jgi:hypothetical protein
METGDSPLESTIRTNDRLKRELRARQRDGESSFHEVMVRILNEHRRIWDLEDDILPTIQEEYDYIASIRVSTIPTISQPSTCIIKIYTGEAESLEDYLPYFDEGRDKIGLPRADDPEFVCELELMATVDGPSSLENAESTPIYMADNVLGAEYLSLDDGLERFYERLEQA